MLAPQTIAGREAAELNVVGPVADLAPGTGVVGKPRRVVLGQPRRQARLRGAREHLQEGPGWNRGGGGLLMLMQTR